MEDWIEIVPRCGEQAYQLCKKACRISTALMLPVVFEFNDIMLTAWPFDKPIALALKAISAVLVGLIGLYYSWREVCFGPDRPGPFAERGVMGVLCSLGILSYGVICLLQIVAY